jgi:hypothetical protein
MTSSQALERGAEILAALLGPYGFKFELTGEGKGSGGRFASGCFVKDDRKLELHFRYSLGMVSYHMGSASLGHETYMRFLRVRDKASYPGFSKEPLSGFRDLARDLKAYCSDFLEGSGHKFKLFVEEYEKNPGIFKGLGALRKPEDF